MGSNPPRQGIARPIPYVPPNNKKIDYTRFTHGATKPWSRPNMMTGFFRGMNAFEDAVAGGLSNADAVLFGASAFYEYYNAGDRDSKDEGDGGAYQGRSKDYAEFKATDDLPRARVAFGHHALQDDAGGMTRVSSSVESILVGTGQQPQQPQDNRALARQDFETYQRHASVPYAV